MKTENRSNAEWVAEHPNDRAERENKEGMKTEKPSRCGAGSLASRWQGSVGKYEKKDKRMKWND